MIDGSTTMDNNLSYIQRLYPLGFRHDAWTLIKLSISLAISYILSSFTIVFVSLIFMSHLGDAEFNACSLANTVYLLISYTLLLGCNYGCDTLLPQYFSGDKRKMGIILQRGNIIAIYVCFISWILMLNAQYVLKWIESDEEIVRLVNTYMQYYLLIVPLTALSLSLRIYIETVGRIIPIIIVNIIGNITNALMHYVCLYQFNLGIHAAPVSITIANGSIVLCYIIYIRFSSLYIEAWHPVTRACLQEWNIYLKYAIPGVMIILTEWWSVETSTLFAAHINNRSLSAQTVAQQVIFITFLVMLAVGDASNILIGQNVGANKPREAKNIKNVVYTVTAAFAAFNSIITIIFHRWLPYIFNVKGSALPLAQNVLLLTPLVNLFDGYHLVQTGIAKACGIQKLTSIIFVIGFDVIGIPLALVLTFTFDMDIYGFWLGMIAAELFTNAVLFVLVYRFDWHTYSQKVVDRIAFESSSQLSKASCKTSISNLDSDECQQPLIYKQDDTKRANLGIQNTKSIELDKLEMKSSETTPDQSLFKLVRVKLAVLFPLVCLFIISVIINYK